MTTMYSLVQWNWFSDVTRCMYFQVHPVTSENQFHCSWLYFLPVIIINTIILSLNGQHVCFLSDLYWLCMVSQWSAQREHYSNDSGHASPWRTQVGWWWYHHCNQYPAMYSSSSQRQIKCQKDWLKKKYHCSCYLDLECFSKIRSGSLASMAWKITNKKSKGEFWNS